MGWGGAGFEPGTAGLQSDVLPLSHHAFPLSHHAFPLSHHAFPGVGNLEWGGNGEGEVSLRATWGQGGWDRIMPKEGLQVSKRGMEGELTRNQQGE